MEEIGRYRGIADHENRLLVEPEDETGRIFYYATADGEVVGTVRISWGGDGPFSERQIAQYALAPFLAEVPPTQFPWASAAWSSRACAVVTCSRRWEPKPFASRTTGAFSSALVPVSRTS